ncbi:MAG: hypothetical protein RIC24_07450 [Hyphomicrobiales bacterium]
MIWLKANLKLIRKLLIEDSSASLTYAALECRLAIEQICYDRLRIHHNYISHADLKRWQPREIVNQLIQEVDQYAASTFKLSVAIDLPDGGERDLSVEEFASLDYQEIGTQIGFDPKRIGKLWNALSSFLHVRLPRDDSYQLSRYGDLDRLRVKLAETVEELERLSKGTLVSSGIGAEVSIECTCGAMIKRRAELLKPGDVVSCIDPTCVERWDVGDEGDDLFFSRRMITVECKGCSSEHQFPEKVMLDLGLNKVAHFDCDCGERNFVRWALQQAANP